ncbi:polymorphic toxin type 27 domain-containing protein [Streptomyces griseus]|uniref:polymorphic toxin type 27 domain-containing protein n=1 Tax=Streptomyces griseus TaxID=1911 RepID=UPI000689ABB1|nr:polymorphic toxin type 27 domain-containing protein [Streptomyces griseus]
MIQAAPAAAETTPPADTGFLRNSIGEEQRRDRCIGGVALHYGGPLMKAKAIEGLTGTAAELRTMIGSLAFDLDPLGATKRDDAAAALEYTNSVSRRQGVLEDANKPYVHSAYMSPDMQWDIPAFGQDVTTFINTTQGRLAGRHYGEDGHTNAGPEAIARARAIAAEVKGKDDWHDYASDAILSDDQVNVTGYTYGTTAADIASYLKHGGFLTQAPAKDSGEYRVEVEDLKQAWAACSYQNPVDIRRVLNELVMTAMTEWELEYAGQAPQRATIVRAELEAATAAREAADNLIEALGNAWAVDQIQTWRKHWQNGGSGAPAPSMYVQADEDVARYRARIADLLAGATSQQAKAAAAAQRAATAQQEAWAVADTAKVPRGRGLMYAQQSVQVARASAASAAAAAKATRTVQEAANATVENADALLAKAQAESKAIGTEFRRVAAEEAAAQAKAAADSATADATAAARAAESAESARTTAEQKRDKAKTTAETAASERAKAQTEKATAVAERTKAATERIKAAAAETRAGTQKTAAQAADTAAGTATAEAAAKRKTADAQAKAAQAARDKAAAALEAKNATAARAGALEAAATAAEGTATAAETRAAATAARTAANEAATAATAAQTAADQATAAAVTARSAATTAEGAAGRARANASAAWSAYTTSTEAASSAHAAAAKALDASQDASARAALASKAAANATALAKKAEQESAAAKTGAQEAAASAGTAVGRAYAAGQAALAARDSATEAVAAAEETFAVGMPYREKDSSAAFAVLVGQSSKTIAEQQAAAAEAKAAEANRAATDAQAAAGQAQGDAKLAAEAAARAAADSVRAVEAVTRAQASATRATDAQTGAKTASEAAAGHAGQAGNDAAGARTAADEAKSTAEAAGREATESERYAAEALEKADRAGEAAKDAAGKATGSEKEAKDAEAKASDANGDSTAAEEAAKKAEREQREKNEAAHKEALAEGVTPIEGGANNWPALGEREEKILLDSCGQTCVDDYRKGLAAVSVDIVKWAGDNGGQILFEQLDAAKVKQCLATSDVEDCLWRLVDFPASSAIVGRVPALSAAIGQVSTGIRQVFVQADSSLHRLNELSRTIRKARETPRLDRCLAGFALHAGGATMKSKAIEALTGTNGQLHDIVGERGLIDLMPLGDARLQDRQDAYAYRDAAAVRSGALEDANRPYAMSSFDDGITLHAPEFGADILGFTLSTQDKLAARLGQDGHSHPGAEAVARAREITEENRGKDTWDDWSADLMLRQFSVSGSGETTASDIAAYLRHGGFLRTKATEGTPEFRIEVESLKQAWAVCDYQDPVDPRARLSAAVSQASAEWEAEYAGQAAPRALIMRAEADAAAATRAATDNMVEAIGQAWFADQVLRWQKYWHDLLERDPDNILKPDQDLFDQADTDLARARGKIQALVAASKTQAEAANAAAARAVTAQKDAWAIADAAEVPRGRGLMYAQQSVQVARASGAAATAAAKATETAFNAAKATVSTSQTLLALAQTESHALSTEFRRIAAQEAAAQAKAAADSAEAYATSAANNAAVAKKAKEEAAAAEGRARTAAADAQRTHAVAEMERANAAAYRATAERERDVAAGHEADAVAQGRIASDARASAEASGTIAADKRKAAEQAEKDAVAARDKALEAEQRRDSLVAKAESLEAQAFAVEGTDAAEAARAAATGAREAANTATAAATNARTAANAATAAAVNAREAATKAQGSASRAQAAADATWASHLVASSSAATAHAKAAEAIDASEAAAANAKGAKEQADKANTAAKTAKAEAAGAQSEAEQTASAAATTAGRAYAAVAASLAARDSATAVTKPANEAIALGTPYQENDSSAAFAVLTGQSSLTAAQQQAAVADATADLAEEFSAEAKALAAQAAADTKAALEASATAATDALRAAKAYQQAQTSASQSAADAKSAQDSAIHAQEHEGTALYAALMSNWAANQAGQDAAAADSAAAEAEHDAAHARTVATQAETDAAVARTTADKAEVDATAAEKAAEGARGAAEEAQAAADRTETSGHSQQVAEGITTGIGGVWAVLDHMEFIGEPKNVVKENCNPIIHVGNCIVTADITYKAHVDLYMCMETNPLVPCAQADTVYLGREVSEARTERLRNVISMVKFNSGIDPIDILVGDFIGCAEKIAPGGEEGSWGDCAWAASWFVAGALFKTAKTAVTALDASIKTGIGFTEAFRALRTIGLTETVIQGIFSRILRRIGTACQLASPATLKIASFSATTANDEWFTRCKEILDNIVKNGDHIVLGINPYSDDLARSIGGRTFNGPPYGSEIAKGLGYAEGQPIWTVGVEKAVQNGSVKLSVTLDGVEGAKTADEALSALLARGEKIGFSDWELIRSKGYGTAWEMSKLRMALRMEYRTWDSIEWYMTNAEGKVVRVYPTRMTFPNGTPVP